MKRVIKNQKKMKNTMYVVFGVFALALFAITRSNPSFASDGLILDDALDAIAGGNITENLSLENEESENKIEEQNQEHKENKDNEDLEIILDNESDDKGEESQKINEENIEDSNEGDNNEISQNLEDKDLEGNDNEKQETEITEGNNENNTKQEEIEENVSTEQNSQDNENNIFENNKFNSMDYSLSTLGQDSEENPYIVYDEENGLITVYSEDFSYGITLQDRNLGAEISGTGEESYGNYYKWGRNTPRTKDEYDYELDNNAWGGGDDNNTEENIIKGYNTLTHKTMNLENGARQGPCNEGYHVPSAGEWNELIKLYYNSINKSNLIINKTGKYSWSVGIEEDTDLKFVKDLKIPFAGRYYLGYSQSHYGTYAMLWSSSPDGNSAGRSLSVGNDGRVNPSYYNREDFHQVRCFKDEYIRKPKTIRFDANRGTFSGGLTIEQHTYYYSGSEIIPIYNIQIPDRISDDMSQQSGWMFAGWYTKDGTNNDWGEEFDISNPQITTAYAKWLPFNDLEVTIGDLTFTIMDRNMGAENAANGLLKEDNNNKPEDDSKLGYYYQWGNNYGFKNIGTPIHSDITAGNNDFRIDADEYGPNNYYYSNYFKKIRTDPHRWTKNNNRNLWGGEDINSSEQDRKGPCPEGYHIPNSYEWTTFYYTFRNAYYNNELGCDVGSSYTDFVKCFISKLKIPIAGHMRDYYATIEDKGVYSSYWTSTPGNDNFSANSNGIRESYIGSFYGYSNRVWGSSVRCFKNNATTKNVNIITDDGKYNDRITLNRWDSLDDLIRKYTIYGYQFSGYKNNEGLDIGDWNYYNNINIYFNKNPKYSYNANGGVFNNNNSEKRTIYTLVKKTSHTHNIFEDQSTYANYDYNLDVNDVIIITGARYLNIKFEKNRNEATPNYMFYRRGADDYDFLTIWTGIHYDYKGFENQDKALFGKADLKAIWNDNIPEFSITGDSVTIGFTSYGSSSSYGYYATITGIVYTDDNGKYLSSLQLDDIPIRLGYEFSGWYESGALEPFDFTGTKITQDRIFYAKWNPHHYTIKFNKNEGSGLVEDIDATYGEEIRLPTMTREGYTFRGWQSEDGILYKNIIPEGTGVTAEDGVTVTLTAQWEKIQESSGNSSSGGGGRKSEQTTRDIAIDTNVENEHNSADEKDNVEKTEQNKTVLNNETSNQVISVTQETSEDGTVEAIIETVKIKDTDIIATVRTEVSSSSSPSSSNYTKEQNEAYSFAQSNGITTTSSIETAKMNTELTRIQMAKMLSNFAINVLGQEPDISKGIVKFKDVTNKMDKQYDNAVTKSYQLGIMGQNVKDNKFRPNDKVTRAEFSTALSRLLYKTDEGNYKGTGKYYEPHIAKLYNEGIINKADPSIKEKRGYVMTMLMRTAK